MRRRRRPLRPLGPRPLNTRPQKLLRRAHHLMETGDYANAAAIFERLARGAHDRGMLRHAPNLYLQAGRANLLGGKTENGVDLLRQGLKIFAETQRWPALYRAGERAVDELNQLGHPEVAKQIAQWLKETLPESPEIHARPGSSRSPRLPLKCPHCGGAIHPNEVEMLDDVTGECPYCGSAVRGSE